MALGLKPRPSVRKVRSYTSLKVTVKERNAAWRSARVAHETHVDINVNHPGLSRRCRAGRCFYKSGKNGIVMRSDVTADCLTQINADPYLSLES